MQGGWVDDSVEAEIKYCKKRVLELNEGPEDFAGTTYFVVSDKAAIPQSKPQIPGKVRLEDGRLAQAYPLWTIGIGGFFDPILDYSIQRLSFIDENFEPIWIDEVSGVRRLCSITTQPRCQVAMSARQESKWSTLSKRTGCR